MDTPQTWHGMQVISRGANRVCVHDPELEHHCLKFELRPEAGARSRWRRLLRFAMARRCPRMGINGLELRAYRRLRARLGTTLDERVAECLELVRTPHGIALRCRTVTDAQGRMAPNLHAVLQGRTSFEGADASGLSSAVDRLQAWLLETRIPLFDLNPGNFVVVRTHDEPLRLVCVDVKSTLARKEVIPLSRLSQNWAARKIRRRSERLRQRILASKALSPLATDTAPI